MASGISNTLNFFVPNKKIVSLEYYLEEKGENALTFTDVLNDIDLNEVTLVFSDLLGGSVTQEIIKQSDLSKVYVIAGFNLALILELITTNEDLIDEEFIVERIIEARNQMVLVNSFFLKEEKNDSTI